MSTSNEIALSDEMLNALIEIAKDAHEYAYKRKNYGKLRRAMDALQMLEEMKLAR